jgi:hypothetical protein
VNLPAYRDVQRERPVAGCRGSLAGVHSMTVEISRVLPLTSLLVLCACSAGAPGTSAPLNARRTGAGDTSAVDVRQSVSALTSRAAGNMEVSAGPLPGSKLLRIRGGYNEVILARANPDGSFSTRCVDSADGADAFLNDTAPVGIVKAAQ